MERLAERASANGRSVRSHRGKTAGFRTSLIASVLFASLAAVLMIPFPFFGDQALFMVFARMMDSGAVLYEDIWDVKQPGIFWFYHLAGNLFGFTAIGVHLLESIYWIVAGVLVAFALRPRLKRQWIAGLAPVLIPGLYFLVSRTNDLTQVEPLISPLVVALVFLSLPGDDGSHDPLRSLGAGLAAGTMVIFKFLAVVVAASLVVVVIGLAITRRSRARELIRTYIVPFGLGFTAPIAALLVWALASGLGDIVWFTWFEYPPQVLSLEPRTLDRLLDAAFRFAIAMSALVALAAVRLIRWPRRERELTLLILAALAGGLALVLLQLWWAYLFFVLSGPLAVLALQGLDDLAEGKRPAIAGVSLLVGALLLPAVLDSAQKARDFGGLLKGESLQSYQALAGGYSWAQQETREVDLRPGMPVYVLGDPLLMYVSDTDQAIAINGWSPEFWTKDLWDETLSELTSEPVPYVYVADSVRELYRERVPDFEAGLEEHYQTEVVTDRGRWLTPRDG